MNGVGHPNKGASGPHKTSELKRESGQCFVSKNEKQFPLLNGETDQRVNALFSTSISSDICW